MRRFNPEPPRCAWCDCRLRNQADVIQHQLEHRGSAEELASGLEQAAVIGLRAVEQEDEVDDAPFYDDDGYSDLGLSDADLEEPQP